jgi:hypothetical protein
MVTILFTHLDSAILEVVYLISIQIPGLFPGLLLLSFNFDQALRSHHSPPPSHTDPDAIPSPFHPSSKMTLSSLPSASGRKPKPDAKTLNARLAHTIPHYSSLLHSAVGSYNSPTPPSSPPREFTNPVSPPIPGEGCARLEPHLPTLQALDTVYSLSEHPILDGYRMIGAGGVGNPWPEEKRRLRDEERGVQGRSGGGGGLGGDDGRMEEDVDEGIEVRTRKAMKVLEDHIRDRTPFVQASSRRMQAVMGVRNELAFGSSLPCCSSLFSRMFQMVAGEVT